MIARPRTLLLVTSAAVAGALGALGSFEVRAHEVAVARSGVVHPPGRHWRLPLGAAPLRLPTRAVEHVAVVAIAGGHQVAVSGRFAVAPAREAEFARRVGFAPFLDGVGSTLETALGGVGVPAEELFTPATRTKLAVIASGALSAAGVVVEDLAVSVPADRNASAVAAATSAVTRLGAKTGRKVMVVGWDGADWLVIRPLLEAGRLPHVRRLMDRGASGELLATKPLLSPLIWTTIATGKHATEHGVADFLVKDESGGVAPIGSAARRVHALWTMLPAFDLRNDVVGWWATWPAEPTRGTLVTDRVAYQLFHYRQDPSGAGKVHPAAAWDWVKGELVPAEKVPHAEIARYVDVDAAEYERAWTSLPPERRHEDRVNHLRKVLATTHSYHRMALSMLRQQSDLTLVYYEGTDTVGHLFARYLPPAMPGVSAADVRRYGRALPEYYVLADQLLGELVAAADPETTVLLVSDHGFFTGDARPRVDPSDFTAGAPQWHRLHGIVVAAGPGVPRGAVERASVLDVTPTVLALLGMPVPADMPGRPLFGPPAERRLASYESLPRLAPPPVAGAAADDDRVRELAALGYVSAETARRGASTPAGAPGTEAFATEAYNMARMYQARGALDEAAAQYRAAVDRLPSFGVGWAGLAQVHVLRDRHGEAFDTLAAGFLASDAMPAGSVTGLVEIGERAGRLPEAERVLATLSPTYRAQAAWHAARGYLLEKQGRPADALRAYAAALERDALDELAVERTVALLRSLGRDVQARAFLREAEAHADGRVEALNHLAVVSLRQGWGADAERIARRVLRSDPGNPGVLANLALSLGQQRRTGEAARVMAEAVRRDPSDAQNHFNLAALLVEQQRLPEALVALEQAAAHGLDGPRTRVAMARVRFRLGDGAGTRRDLERALAAEPGHREAQVLLAELR